MARAMMAPTCSGSDMPGTLRADPAPRYQPAADALMVLVRATRWTRHTCRTFLTFAHPQSPLGRTRRILAALAEAGLADRARLIYAELGTALVGQPVGDFDALDALEQELDGKENEAQLLRRIELDRTPSEQRRAWATERRIRIRYQMVNAQLIQAGDARWGARD